MTTCADSHLRVRIAISTPHTIRASIIDSYATTIVAIAATGSASIIRTIIIAKCSRMASTHGNSRTCHITWPAPTVPVRIIIWLAPVATPTITPSAAIAIEPRIIIAIEPRIIIAIETTLQSNREHRTDHNSPHNHKATDRKSRQTSACGDIKHNRHHIYHDLHDDDATSLQ